MNVGDYEFREFVKVVQSQLVPGQHLVYNNDYITFHIMDQSEVRFRFGVPTSIEETSTPEVVCVNESLYMTTETLSLLKE